AERGDRDRRSGRGGLAVPQAIHRRHQDAPRKILYQVEVPRLGLSRDGLRRGPELDRRRAHWIHFLAVTIVPFRGSETITNSSISRRTPGRPSPRLRDVE